MFFYILGLLVLVGILGVAGYILVTTIRKEGLFRSNEYKVLQNPDSVVDDLIHELIKIDKEYESEEILITRKIEILNTFVELHKSGSFCAHLTEEEVILFVKQKLNIGDK